MARRWTCYRLNRLSAGQFAEIVRKILRGEHEYESLHKTGDNLPVTPGCALGHSPVSTDGKRQIPKNYEYLTLS